VIAWRWPSKLELHKPHSQSYGGHGNTSAKILSIIGLKYCVDRQPYEGLQSQIDDILPTIMDDFIRPQAYVALRLPSDTLKVVRVVPNTYVT